ncbi:MFS transporter [Streptomyces sp. NPDC002564]|uniref:MFS transporter n=1 Tax=Streptomyces sp. NPDC002564 TaxID=3364649 RepID=UPI0036C89A67
MMRSIWRSVTTASTLMTAMALDTSMMGAALIVGPAFASWLSLSLSPLLPYAAITAMTVVAVATTVTTTSVVLPTSTAPKSWLGPLSSSPLRRLLAADAIFVMAVTAMDVVLPIHARQEGAGELTGLYVGSLAAGSVIGSFALVTAARRLPRGLVLPLLLGLFTLGCGALAVAARLSPVVVLTVCPVAGLVTGSLFTVLRTAGGDLAPARQATETMSWLSTFDTVGGAAGAAMFASLAETTGGSTALALIPGLSVIAALASWRVQGLRQG